LPFAAADAELVNAAPSHLGHHELSTVALDRRASHPCRGAWWWRWWRWWREERGVKPQGWAAHLQGRTSQGSGGTRMIMLIMIMIHDGMTVDDEGAG
jgi:hypothetical protein